jgi:alkylhydroperoxidase family enzyme
MFKATQNGSIPQTTIGLAQLRAGQIVGNTYHPVRQTGDLRGAGETQQRITAVASWRDAPYFAHPNAPHRSWWSPSSPPTRSGSASQKYGRAATATPEAVRQRTRFRFRLDQRMAGTLAPTIRPLAPLE